MKLWRVVSLINPYMPSYFEAKF